MPVLFFFYMSYFDSPKGRQQSGEQLGARLRHIGERQLRGPDEVEQEGGEQQRERLA